MGSTWRVRRNCVIAAVLVGIVVTHIVTRAQTKLQTVQSSPRTDQTKPQLDQPKPQVEPATRVEQLTATSVNVNPGAGENLTIAVSRWSADADRERLVASLAEKGEAELQNVLTSAPTLGYIWTSETLGYSLGYAYRQLLPDGGERIIVATARRLGVWTLGNVWKAAKGPGSPDYPFTVIELRLNRRGVGQGKMSIATKISIDQEAKTIALEDYKTAPVLLKDAKRERTGNRGTG